MRGEKKTEQARRRKKRVIRENYYPIGSRLATLEDLDKKEPVTTVVGVRGQEASKSIKSRVKYIILVSAMLAGIGVWYASHADKSGKEGVQYSYYDSYSEAVSKGAVQGGWIPRYLPDSAYDIHEMHDLKTNSGWISFKFPPSARNKMMERYSPLQDKRIKRISIEGVKTPWWPADLNGQLSAGIARKYSFYLTGRSSYREGLDEYIAVDWVNSRAYVWR